MMKRIIPISTIALISFYFFSQLPRERQKEIEIPKTISFSFVGDLMCHSPQFDAARVSADSFDFRPAFKEIKEILSKADFTIGNLETVIGGKEMHYTGYPMFNTPEDFLYALKDNGFDIVIASNNHSMDRGIIGINKTIDNIKKYGLMSCGTYKSEEERDSTFLLEKNGLKVALLAYTYGLNGNNLPRQKQYAVNLIDTALIRNDIFKAKTQADIVIVYFHFGEEYQRAQNKFQEEIASRTISYGADIIIASHPHVIQPVEYFESSSSKLDQGFIAYSLGNFFSNQRWRYSDCGVVLNFTLAKKKEKIILDTISIDPVWVSKELGKKKNTFRILPSDTSNYKIFRSINQSDRQKLVQSFFDTKSVMKSIESFKRKTSRHGN